MDKSVFDIDQLTLEMDKDLSEYIDTQRSESLLRLRSMAYLHKVLSKPRKLSDEDLCVREGYRNVLSQFKELQMAGRVLARARAEQYDPEGVEDVDPTTRMDYDIFDVADDARRVSERLKAQQAAAQDTSAPESSAPESSAPESPAPESPSSSAQ